MYKGVVYNWRYTSDLSNCPKMSVKLWGTELSFSLTSPPTISDISSDVTAFEPPQCRALGLSSLPLTREIQREQTNTPRNIFSLEMNNRTMLALNHISTQLSSHSVLFYTRYSFSFISLLRCVKLKRPKWLKESNYKRKTVLFLYSFYFSFCQIIYVSFSSPFDTGVINVSRLLLLICRNIRNLC